MERQNSILRGIVVVGLWVLVAATYPIWLVTSDFPQIPFFEFCTPVPVWIDYVLLVVLAVFSLLFGFGNESTRRRWNCGICAAMILAMLVILDQHRFQPWAYLTIIQFVLLSASADSKLSIRLIRFVLVSIYVYSAISKFDHSFCQHLGLRFVDTFLSQIGLSPHLMAPAKKLWMIWLFPIGELLIGIGLAARVTRRYVVGAAIVMHVMLITILGPWGLGHHLGVLVWNILFATQVLIVFGRATPVDDEDPIVWKSVSAWSAVLVTAVCVTLPVLEIAGERFDHWPAWSLYSDRTDKVELFVESDQANKLPPGLLKHLGPPLPFQTWRKLYIEQWSLAETRAPIYPEDRFQIGVAAYLASRYGLGDADQEGVKLILHGPPNRATGDRKSQTFVGMAEINEVAHRFRLNTVARER